MIPKESFNPTPNLLKEEDERMNERPWYKRWQLWVFVVVVLAMIGAMQDDEPTPNVAQADTSETISEGSPNDVYREPEPQYDDPGAPGYDPTLDPGYAELERECKAAWDAAGERTPPRSPVNNGNIQINGANNEIKVEYHLHKHKRPRRQPVQVTYPIMRHEMIIVPSDGNAPVVFADIAPPRVATVDKEVARAYSAHMLRLAKRHGTPKF